MTQTVYFSICKHITKERQQHFSARSKIIFKTAVWRSGQKPSHAPYCTCLGNPDQQSRNAAIGFHMLWRFLACLHTSHISYHLNTANIPGRSVCILIQAILTTFQKGMADFYARLKKILNTIESMPNVWIMNAIRDARCLIRQRDCLLDTPKSWIEFDVSCKFNIRNHLTTNVSTAHTSRDVLSTIVVGSKPNQRIFSSGWADPDDLLECIGWIVSGTDSTFL